ncbi:hypothetical protein HBI56_106320 [Parastagonospora nodorum]|nr:hypothetical protein HBH56_132570 [Parastagonospora nodorum]KAH3926897.1 hypothetical protein HBH54_160660 [Parastagonospora nodorum]KAH3949541.1 hypothetical protein HBH53_087530 [Parastagonospora nodorum]KAH3974859.1 hypothetical protein HBH52_133970 [Parastagonospora nodorum]KAH3977984.1 hypothetical protein HBH51_068350 [Parastagonospora nodorum]
MLQDTIMRSGPIRRARGTSHDTTCVPRSEPSSGAAPFISYPPRGLRASCVHSGWPYRRTQPMGSISPQGLSSCNHKRRAPRQGPVVNRRKSACCMIRHCCADQEV